LLLLLLACLFPHLIARIFGRSPVPPRFLGAAALVTAVFGDSFLTWYRSLLV